MNENNLYDIQPINALPEYFEVLSALEAFSLPFMNPNNGVSMRNVNLNRLPKILSDLSNVIFSWSMKMTRDVDEYSRGLYKCNKERIQFLTKAIKMQTVQLNQYKQALNNPKLSPEEHAQNKYLYDSTFEQLAKMRDCLIAEQKSVFIRREHLDYVDDGIDQCSQMKNQINPLQEKYILLVKARTDATNIRFPLKGDAFINELNAATNELKRGKTQTEMHRLTQYAELCYLSILKLPTTATMDEIVPYGKDRYMDLRNVIDGFRKMVNFFNQRIISLMDLSSGYLKAQNTSADNINGILEEITLITNLVENWSLCYTSHVKLLMTIPSISKILTITDSMK